MGEPSEVAGVAESPAGRASIREAGQVDLLWVVQAIERCFTELGLPQRGLPFDRLSTGRFLLTLLLSGQGKIWLAELDGLPVGLRAGQLSPYPFDGRLLMATGLLWYVEPDARALGFGEQLYERFEAWARDCGAGLLSAWPLASAQSTRAFFEDRGYRLVEEHFIKEI